MLMPMLSPDSFTAFVFVLNIADKLTSADQPLNALPLDPIDGEVTLNVAAFSRSATPLIASLSPSILRRDSSFYALCRLSYFTDMSVKTGFEPVTSVFLELL